MKKKISLLVILTLLVTFSIAFTAFAASGNVTYSGDAGKFIFALGSKYSLTDLFTEYKSVMPGDVLEQKITVKNNASDNVSVKIYLRSLGAVDEESKDFLKQLKLTVKKASEDPMYEAPADEKAGLTDWVCLGTFGSGTSIDLNLNLEVPTSLDNTYSGRIGYLDWEFMVEENENRDPITGDANNYLAWIIVIALAAVTIISAVIVLFVKRKIREK